MTYENFIASLDSGSYSLKTLEALNRWKEENNVRGFSFRQKLPRTSQTLETHTPEEDSVTNKVFWEVLVRIDAAGKIDIEPWKPRVNRAVFNHDTGKIGLVLSDENSSGEKVVSRDADAYLLLSSVTLTEPKEKDGPETIKPDCIKPLIIERQLLRQLMIPLINRQLETGKEEYFSRNGMDILKEELRQPMANEMMRTIKLSSLLGRPGDKALTKRDILVKNGGTEDIPKTVNRLPLSMGCMVREFLRFFPKEHIKEIMTRERLQRIQACLSGIQKERNLGYNDSHSSAMKFIKDTVIQILAEEFYSKAGDSTLEENYLVNCDKLGIKADISLCKTESSAHRRLMNANNLLLTRVSNEYREDNPDVLKIKGPYRALAKEIAPMGFAMLMTAGELIMESDRNGNCVRSYASKVNSGRCAIFTKDSPHCTVEVCFQQNSDGTCEFTCPQYYAIGNSYPDNVRAEHTAFNNFLSGFSDRYSKKINAKKTVSENAGMPDKKKEMMVVRKAMKERLSSVPHVLSIPAVRRRINANYYAK